ncbi:hypothetical protein ABZX77_06625 [Streptomyces sp. NPDC004237]|uniref:hypothetical protein n=1 Tax=Streptomyces sp. NPDC004237 TaxID=3154455 RepID=UPI0033AC77CC
MRSGASVIPGPDNETDDALEEGDAVKLQPVAKAETDSSGTYRLRIESLDSLSPVAATDGTVNFEILARDNGKTVPFNFSRRLVTSSSSAKALAATYAYSTTDATSETTSTLTADPVSATLTLDSTAAEVTEEGATGELTEDASATPTPAGDASEVTGDEDDTTTPDDADDIAAAVTGVSKGCVSQLKKKLSPKWVIVGQTYSKTTGVAHSLTYTRSAASELGVGISATGTYGTYTGSGTNSKSTSSTTTFPTFGNNTGVYYKTEFNYGKYLVTCTYADSGYWWQEQHYEVRARSHAGGAVTSSAAFPSYKLANCFNYQKGSTFTKTKSSAITWTNGASLAAAIGIDLSAQTGYASDATVSYTFNQTRALCGTGGTPGGGHPYNFLARKKK